MPRTKGAKNKSLEVTEVKVGEVYKIKPGHEDQCGNYESRSDADAIKITEVWGDGLCYEILDSQGRRLGGCGGCFKLEDLIHANANYKPKPVKYVLGTIERFTDKASFVKRLKELKEQGSLSGKSIFEVKHELEPKFATSVSLRRK